MKGELRVDQPKTFLTAEWKRLLMLNYAVDPSLVRPFVPAGTELDSFAGRFYVSLVGFEFNRTRIAGFSIPFHSSFEEVNLRFYVRRADRRGVVFIRELVPKWAVAATARFVYGENYSCVSMAHRVTGSMESRRVEAEYSWGRGSAFCAMWMETEQPDFLPVDGSLSQFITEHYWGYTARQGGGCLEYEVRHPRWKVREGTSATLKGNAARFYGDEFAKVLAGSPDSAFLAEGSGVTVFKGRELGA